MGIPEEKQSQILTIYENRLNKSHQPLKAYEETVKFLLSKQGYSVKEIMAFFGKNAKKFPHFDPSFNRYVNGWAKELYKICLLYTSPSPRD